MKITTPFGLLLAVALTATSLPAAVIITPTGAISSLGNLSSRPIEKAIDSSGLSGGGTSGNILSETHENMASNTGPYFLGAINSVLTFDLGSPFAVDTVHLWSYTRTGETDRGVRNFDISFSSDGVNFSNTISSLTDFAEIPYVGSPPVVNVQSRSFATQTGVTHIRLSSVTNHGDTGFTGFGEIRFGAIPEPSAALLGGLGLLALLRRRRG